MQISQGQKGPEARLIRLLLIAIPPRLPLHRGRVGGFLLAPSCRRAGTPSDRSRALGARSVGPQAGSLSRMLASVALRVSIGSRRRSRRVQKEAEGNRSSR
jgi:hypothetical protein